MLLANREQRFMFTRGFTASKFSAKHLQGKLAVLRRKANQREAGGTRQGGNGSVWGFARSRESFKR